MNELSHQEIEQVFVARQPIFTPQMGVWGYELLFRHSREAQSAFFADGNRATAKVIIDGFAIARQGLSGKARMFVNFSKQMILDDIPLALPGGEVIEILEEVVPTPDFMAKCLELKKDYFIAVDDYTGQKGWEKLLALANIIKVDVLNLTEADLSRITAELKPFPGKLLAEKVEDHSMFCLASELGFQFFQGFFFKKPSLLTGRKLSSNEMTRLQIFNELGQQDIDQDRLKTVIQSDVSITYRLLTYINSPGLGLMGKVNSIDHALKMLGEKQVRQWLRVLILADLDASPKGQEVIQSSAIRAFFLKNLSEFYPPPLQIDALFTIGLLSMIDALLNQPMTEILQQVPLQDEIKSILLGKNDKAGTWLQLAQSIETGQWQEVDRLSNQTGFRNEILGQAYSRALIQSRLLLS